MRIAIHHASEVGVRTGRILLGERALIALGVADGSTRSADPRVRRVDDLADYEVLVTDDLDDPLRWADEALDAGIHCVLWAPESVAFTEEGSRDGYAEAFRDEGKTLVVGANLGSAVAPALASHEIARAGEVFDVSIAYTEPGTPLRRGEAVPFPDPVGAHWGREQSKRDPYRTLVTPLRGAWAGALARVTTASSDGVVTRILGVADLAEHLEAIAIAAGAIAAADGLYPPGVQPAWIATEGYLARALAVGLEVASYTAG
jgi:hypothetical protein